MSQFEVRYMSHAQENGEATSRDTTSHSQAKTYPLLNKYINIYFFVKSSIPYTIYNGVSPVRIWHPPVTIKDETYLLKPHPNYLETPHP